MIILLEWSIALTHLGKQIRHIHIIAYLWCWMSSPTTVGPIECNEPWVGHAGSMLSTIYPITGFPLELKVGFMYTLFHSTTWDLAQRVIESPDIVKLGVNICGEFYEWKHLPKDTICTSDQDPLDPKQIECLSHWFPCDAHRTWSVL